MAQRQPSYRWTRQLPPLKKKPCPKPTKKIGARYPYAILSTTWARMNDESHERDPLHRYNVTSEIRFNDLTV